METLVQAIQQKAGITEEQAQKALEAVKEFVVQQFPMMEGAVNILLNSQAKNDDGLD